MSVHGQRPVEVIGSADRKIHGRLQIGSPIKKFGMKPYYYIGLDLGQAQSYTVLVVLERLVSSGLRCQTSAPSCFPPS